MPLKEPALKSALTTAQLSSEGGSQHPQQQPQLAMEVLDADDFAKLKFSDKVQFIRNYITVEPMLACYIMPSVLSSLAVQNMNLQKACRVNLQYPDHICTALVERNTANYSHEEIDVQTLVASMTIWKTALQSSLPALLIMFLGAWSDRRGRRKPCMLLPIIGEFMTTIGLILCTYYFMEWPMEVAGVIEAIFPALTGGWMTMFMAIFSYIADITTVEMRTFRIGVVNIFVSLGIPIGTALSGILYKQIGFYGIFSISAMFYLAGFCYGVIYIREANSRNNERNGSCPDFFKISHVVETFKIVSRKREGNTQRLIILLMVVFSVILGPMYGETAVMYLYARYRFNWDEVDYSLFATYYVIINLIGTLISITVFSRWLKLDDMIIGVIACSSKVAASFLYAFSKTSTMFYLAPLVDIVSGTGVIALRSITTKIVDSNEQGKIHSLFGVCEAVVPLIYSPMYSALYVNTLKTLPGAFFLLGAAMTVPAIGIFAWMYFLQKQDRLNAMSKVKTPDLFKYTIPVNELVIQTRPMEIILSDDVS